MLLSKMILQLSTFIFLLCCHSTFQAIFSLPEGFSRESMNTLSGKEKKPLPSSFVFRTETVKVFQEDVDKTEEGLIVIERPYKLLTEAARHQKWKTSLKPKKYTQVDRGDTFLRYCEIARIVLSREHLEHDIRDLAHLIAEHILKTYVRVASYSRLLVIPYGKILQEDLDNIIQKAIKVLSKSDLAKNERYWLLGFLDNAQKTFPRRIFIPTYANQNELSRGELELSLVKGTYLFH